MENKKQTTFEKFAELLHEKRLVGVATEVVETDNFVKDYGFDSLDVVDLATQIEEKFLIDIDDKELAKINTVGDAVKAIDKKLAKQPVIDAPDELIEEPVDLDEQKRINAEASFGRAVEKAEDGNYYPVDAVEGDQPDRAEPEVDEPEYGFDVRD